MNTQNTVGTFEAHITTDPLTEDDQISKLRGFASRFGFRVADLYKGSGEPSTRDMFMTGWDENLVLLTERTRRLCELLNDLGYRVRRYKIEATLVDSRTEDVFDAVH